MHPGIAPRQGARRPLSLLLPALLLAGAALLAGCGANITGCSTGGGTLGQVASCANSSTAPVNPANLDALNDALTLSANGVQLTQLSGAMADHSTTLSTDGVLIAFESATATAPSGASATYTIDLTPVRPGAVFAISALVCGIRGAGSQYEAPVAVGVGTSIALVVGFPAFTQAGAFTLQCFGQNFEGPTNMTQLALTTP